MTKSSGFRVSAKGQRRQGFTLLQIVLVVAILGVLSAVLLSVFGRARVPAYRAACDIHLKEISLALDNFRQERGRMPTRLNELVENNYIPADTLRCPADFTYDSAHAKDASYSSYGDGYIIRETRDSGELPIVVCSFHEKDGAYGAQAYKGGYSKQFAARPALLLPGDYDGTVTITRPGSGVLSLPKSGDKPLVLRGGDRIVTGSGTAKISFEDGSTASISASSDMSVLQSFTEGQRSGLLYTLVRQFSGRVTYYVNPGSNFDVATPTATAGALGTEFTIELVPASSLASGTSTLAPSELETVLTVTKHAVALTTTDRTIEVQETEPAVAAHDPKNKKKVRKPKKAKK